MNLSARRSFQAAKSHYDHTESGLGGGGGFRATRIQLSYAPVYISTLGELEHVWIIKVPDNKVRIIEIVLQLNSV